MFRVVPGVGLSIDEPENEKVRQDVANANESVSRADNFDEIGAIRWFEREPGSERHFVARFPA